MTPEQHQAQDRWRETHKTGSAAARDAERQRRRQHKAARQLLERLDEAPPAAQQAAEIQALDEAADVARRRLAALQQSPETRDRPMIDDDDLDDGEEELRLSILRRARSEGIRAAYEAALRIVRNERSPAQATASAARTLLEIGGMLDRHDRAQEAADGRSPSELSAGELSAMVSTIKKRLRSRRNGDANGADAAGDVFG